MVRVTFSGDELAGLTIDQPAASVRLLLPRPGTDQLVMPTWNGNEFLLPDGERPTIRTFTPHGTGPETPELDIDIVLHGTGSASEWAERAKPGDRAAVSGPGRGYEIDASASAFLLAGDQTAIPAISQLLEAIPADLPVTAMIEVAEPDARMALPDHPKSEIQWLDLTPGDAPGNALVAAVREAALDPAAQVWAAGEAAAVQRIRRHLFDDRDLPRSQATVRGYWKHGRLGT